MPDQNLGRWKVGESVKYALEYTYVHHLDADGNYHKMPLHLIMVPSDRAHAVANALNNVMYPLPVYCNSRTLNIDHIRDYLKRHNLEVSDIITEGPKLEMYGELLGQSRHRIPKTANRKLYRIIKCLEQESTMLGTLEQKLLTSLEELLRDVDTGGDRSDASCHSNICSVGECCQCQRVMRARDAVKSARTFIPQDRGD